MTQSNSTRDVTLNIVIPSYNRDGILTKCLEHLDRVFSPASVNNSNVGINISTTVTVYHQAKQPNSFDVPVENINLRVCNRSAIMYTGLALSEIPCTCFPLPLNIFSSQRTVRPGGGPHGSKCFSVCVQSQ